MDKFYRGLRRWILAGLLVLAAVLVFGCVENPGGSADRDGGSLTVESAPGQTEGQEPQTEQESRRGQDAQAGQGTGAGGESQASPESGEDRESWEQESQAGEEKPEKIPSGKKASGTGETDGIETDAGEKGDSESGELTVFEDGEYRLKDEVALYLHEYGHLPGNYITKKEAQELGWDNKKGNLSEVAPGKSIGGSHFGNYEKALPEKKGRKYYECDLEYEGGYRGAKRLIYSNDGLIFYTEDHYQTFEQLYPQE